MKFHSDRRKFKKNLYDVDMINEKLLSDYPKITIGLPVYNGEANIRNSLDFLLSQTFTNFELIISDNASTDSTQNICQDYAKGDKRIHYIRQERNIGALSNYEFVLKNAKSKYFMWAGVDDAWHPTFLEKNVKVLESDDNIVGSISEVEFSEKIDKNWKLTLFESTTRKSERYRHVHPVTGSYEQKVKFYLKFGRATAIYAVYRTEKLQKSIGFHYPPMDLMIILNVLRYGNLYVIDEVLMYRNKKGLSSKGMIAALRAQNVGRFDIVFMYLRFIFWCIDNFGLKFILQNLDLIILLHYRGYGRMALDFIRQIKSIIKKSEI